MDLNINFEVNEDILKDKNRIEPFIQAISRNPHLFREKVILDINCGSGILSILALRAGAKHVFCTHANAATKQIITDNHLIDKVTLFESEAKDIPKVDVIIAQWVGSMLLFDSHIQEVITARDKFLIKDGVILPDKAQIYVQSVEDQQYKEKKVNFWDSVYGVSMRCMKAWVLREPLLESVQQTQINGDPSLIYQLDLNTANIDDLSFSNSYLIKINRNDYVTGITAWFEVIFSQCHIPIKMSMDPSKKRYWKPAIFYFNSEVPVFKGDKLSGTFALKYQKEQLDIKISAHLTNRLEQYKNVQYYRLN